MYRIAFLFAAAILFIAAAAIADIPRIMSYQGVLADASGSAVSDGNYSITFRLYTAESGGSPIWEETQTVAVKKGIFEAKLGSYTPLDLSFSQRYYLGISVEGGAELAPRTQLCSAPYSLTSSRLEGATNVFPSEGHVGIGTKMPNYPLHVLSTTGQVGIRFDGNDDYWSSIYINALKSTGKPFLGLLRGGILNGGMYLDTNNNLLLMAGGNEQISITHQGNVGIGDFAPNQKLVVNGGLKIANTTTATAGSVRFTGTDFEGYDGSSWKSFTATGSETVPPGTAGQTLRHDGSNWIATSNLWNDGSKIGIGTTSPLSKLHISGDGMEAIVVESSLLWGGSNLTLKTSGGDYDFLQVSKFGPTATGNVSGIPAANLSLINAGVNAGPLMLRTASSSNMHFVTNNTEWLRLSADGALDYFGPSYNKLLEVTDVPEGGKLDICDAAGNPVISAFASTGSGQMIFHTRTGSMPGIVMDGNLEGSGSAGALFTGSAGWAGFDLRNSGHSSVFLPNDAINREEVWDEPGLANDYHPDAVPIGIYTVIATRSIVVPTGGLILAIANGCVDIPHTPGVTSAVTFGISTSATSIPSSCSVYVTVPGELPAAVYSYPVGACALFATVASGTYTFYFLGLQNSGSSNFNHAQLTLLYIPTAYGEVEPVALLHPEATYEKATSFDAFSIASDVALERARAEALNKSRMERELDAMRTEIEKLKASMKLQ